MHVLSLNARNITNYHLWSPYIPLKTRDEPHVKSERQYGDTKGGHHFLPEVESWLPGF